MLNASVNIQYEESGYEYGEPFTAKSVIVREDEILGAKTILIVIRGAGSSRATLKFTPSLFAAIEQGVQAVLGENAVKRVELTVEEESATG